ncbi:MAG: hypothetical protein ABFR05_12120 [Bacteroidota bacterium]
MTTKNYLKAVSFVLIFTVGIFALSSWKDNKVKQLEKQSVIDYSKSTKAYYANFEESKCGDDKKAEKKDKDSKCGDGKCGDDKKAAAKDSDKKCGEGKCGDDKKAATKESDKKCGEGKCGNDKKVDKKEKETKCGEGKCGS